MSYILSEVGRATNPKRSLIFVRGFTGVNELSRALARLRFSEAARRRQTLWYRALRRWGYQGRLLMYRWDCHWSDCFSATARDALVDEAADALCELVDRLDDFSPCNTSVLG